MDKKGQIGLGMFLVMFITLIVGVVLFQAVAQEAGKSTTLWTISNETFTASAVNVTYTFTNYRALSDVIVTNATEGQVVPATNYTVANNQVVNGMLATTITFNDDSPAVGQSTNISATAQPLTYIPDSAGRSIVGLIAIFFALAIAVIALEPTLRSGVLNAIGR